MKDDKTCGNGIVYVKPDVFCVDTIEHNHLRERIAAAEEALDNLNSTHHDYHLGWGECNCDAHMKARAYFEKYGDKP